MRGALCLDHIMIKYCSVLILATLLSAVAAGQRIEIGTQFTYFHQKYFHTRHTALVGLRTSWQLVPHLSLEAQVDTSVTRRMSGGSSLDGGQLTLGNFGFRVDGPRLRRMQPFALARGGFVSNGAALTRIQFGVPSFKPRTNSRLTEPSFNFGGGANVMLSRRIGLRMDLQDTVAFYHKRQIIVGSTDEFNGITLHNFQSSVGMFLRF